MSWVAAGVAGVGVAANLIQGGIRTHKANKALKELGAQKYPEFVDDPRMINSFNRAQAMSAHGYTAEERAAFDQNLARNNSMQYRQSVDMGGGQLGNSINGVLQANNIDAINKFASDDAGLRRDNIQYADSLAQRLQTQKNLQTQNLIARRQMLEQAYGAAKSSGQSQMMGAINSATAIGSQLAMGSRSAAAGSEGNTGNLSGNDIYDYNTSGSQGLNFENNIGE